MIFYNLSIQQYTVNQLPQQHMRNRKPLIDVPLTQLWSNLSKQMKKQNQSQSEPSQKQKGKIINNSNNMLIRSQKQKGKRKNNSNNMLIRSYDENLYQNHKENKKQYHKQKQKRLSLEHIHHMKNIQEISNTDIKIQQNNNKFNMEIKSNKKQKKTNSYHSVNQVYNKLKFKTNKDSIKNHNQIKLNSQEKENHQVFNSIVNLGSVGNVDKYKDYQGKNGCKSVQQNNSVFISQSQWQGIKNTKISQQVIKIIQNNVLPFMVQKFVNLEQKISKKIHKLQQIIEKQQQNIKKLKQNQKLLLESYFTLQKNIQFPKTHQHQISKFTQKSKGNFNQSIYHQQSNLSTYSVVNEQSRINVQRQISKSQLLHLTNQIDELTKNLASQIQKNEQITKKIETELKKQSEKQTETEIKFQEKFAERVLQIIRIYNGNFVDLDQRIGNLQKMKKDIEEVKIMNQSDSKFGYENLKQSEGKFKKYSKRYG